MKHGKTTILVGDARCPRCGGVKGPGPCPHPTAHVVARRRKRAKGHQADPAPLFDGSG